MKAPARNFRRVQERHFSAHHALLRVARHELDRAKRKEPGWFDSIFVVLTFSSLAIEAITNAVGGRVVADWRDFESASPNAKVRLLAERLGIGYSPKGDPWETIRWLGKFRNSVAHAKPEHVVHDQRITAEDANQRSTDPPKSKLERDVTLTNATRALDAVNSLMAMYCGKSQMKTALVLTLMAGPLRQGHSMRYNPTVDLVPFGHWTLRDEAA